MALALVLGKVMFVEVMVETAYGRQRTVDYPNLAGKVNKSCVGAGDSPASSLARLVSGEARIRRSSYSGEIRIRACLQAYRKCRLSNRAFRRRAGAAHT